MHLQNIITFGLIVAVCSLSAHCAPSLEKREVTEPLCPDGWTLFGEKCYLYSGNETANWDAAQASCYAVEGQLVEIESYAEKAFLVELKSNFSSYSSESWIGLIDREKEGKHVWDSTGIGASYQSWGANEPNGEACIQMDSNSYWYDANCNLERTYFCERLVKAKCPSDWTFFRGHCYKYSREVRKVWEEAEAACVADKGHLVDINSVGENEFLVNLMNAVLIYISDAWIGLNDREINDTYVWVSTGKNVTYTNWGQYQPDDVVWTQACVLMDKRKGQWDDKRCSYSRPYICKKDKASPKPTSMIRAKEWSPEVEEAWRFQLAGYRDDLDYKNVKNPEGAERWPHNGYVKKLQRRDGVWYYYDKGRELRDKDIPKCILYVY